MAIANANAAKQKKCSGEAVFVSNASDSGPDLQGTRTQVSMRALRMVLYAFAATLVGATVFLAVSDHPLAHLIESGPARHALAFAVLPVITSIAWPRLRFLPHLLLYTAFGAAIEIAQSQMQAGRTGELEDWLVDVAVTLFVLAAIEQVRISLDRRKRGSTGRKTAPE